MKIVFFILFVLVSNSYCFSQSRGLLMTRKGAQDKPVCDAGHVLSGYYFDSLEQKLSSHLGLSFPDSFTILEFDIHKEVNVKLDGHFSSVRFYLLYVNRKQLMARYLPAEMRSDNIFKLGMVGLDEGVNYLIIVAQCDYHEFDIQKIALTTPDPETFNVTIGKMGTIAAEIKPIRYDQNGNLK